jgi:hypothetical protein
VTKYAAITLNNFDGFEVVSDATMKSTVFWD